MIAPVDQTQGKVRPATATTIFALLAGPIVWAAHLGVVYFAQSMLCAHDRAADSLFGVGIVPGIVVVATLGALAVLGAATATGVRWRFGTRGSGDTTAYRMIVFGLAILSATGIVWAGVTTFFLPSCDALR